MAGTLIGEDEAARFDELQRKLVPLWHSIQTLTPHEQTIVVVPSLSVDDLSWTATRRGSSRRTTSRSGS